ncbi:MAG: hypothetical protein EBZ77_15805 [Chitinophagia bacterium]|nr:hypothetical protein [Chitinophagia bacterium]
MEAIVLAGGLGTRLQSVIGAYPKCMAEVAGQPFLYYVLRYLQAQGCSRAILSLGFKSEVITDWLSTQQFPFPISYVIEDEPLGTGGGIQLALRIATEPHVCVLNGDTLFQVNLPELMAIHNAQQSAATLALKEMFAFDRYGVVTTSKTGVITAFEEKQYRESGWINGGIYVIDRAALLARQLPERFSFEKDFLECFVSEGRFVGCQQQGYFIDIGIPADYERAQHDFKTLVL